ncbi:MAG: glycosyltransferase family 2 protein [Clostridiales bacterium]|jgi:dolichol-phosphate mannosyltransferase|nr:glycosyltransferase family 2 protein [Clostridiales bacterium]
MKKLHTAGAAGEAGAACAAGEAAIAPDSEPSPEPAPAPVECSVIVPLYNEEAVINETCRRLKEVMDASGSPYEILLVNDGSRDRTALHAAEICRRDRAFKLISLSRNFGHQVAISAGMDYAAGSAVVVIDADLQDPPAVIPDMLAKWRDGYEVVYGKRLRREGESLFKKLTARFFYRFLNSMTDVDIPADVGDFRLIDRKVCDAFKRINERNRYVRGLIGWLGFKTAEVEFVREKRFAGETKYPLRKMARFALDAIISFSHRPLKLASYMGLLMSLLSFLYLLVVIWQRVFTDTTVTGWASSLAVSLFFNGITLIMLGIVGEYIGRVYDEVKGRPLYIVSRTENMAEAEADGGRNEDAGKAAGRRQR